MTLSRLTSFVAFTCMSLATVFSAANAQTALPIANPSIKPVDDPFYVAPGALTLLFTRPGDVLRYRPIPTTTYSANVSEAYQLMFRSTDGRGAATASVTTLLIPKTAPATGRRLLSYQAFYDSLQLNCTPSGLTLTGQLFERGFVNPALQKGVLVVLPDYEGLDSQWIAGLNTAHGVLDGIRAAENFKLSGLSSASPVAMMGFSGGGHATGWANELASTYAPELNIVGTAMGGVPVDLINIAKRVDGTLFAGVYFTAVVGLSRANPQLIVTDYATPAGVAMVKDIGNRCFMGMLEGQPEVLTPYAFKSSTTYLKDPNFLNLPVMQAINKENTLGSRTPKAPVYVYEGTLDEVIPVADVDALVKTYCARGVRVDYHRTALDHLLGAVSPTGGMNYVLDMLDGKPATSNCP